MLNFHSPVCLKVVGVVLTVSIILFLSVFSKTSNKKDKE